MSESRWKQILPFALKYDVNPRGFGPREIAEQIFQKARQRKIDLSKQDEEDILDIVMPLSDHNGDRPFKQKKGK